MRASYLRPQPCAITTLALALLALLALLAGCGVISAGTGTGGTDLGVAPNAGCGTPVPSPSASGGSSGVSVSAGGTQQLTPVATSQSGAPGGAEPVNSPGESFPHPTALAAATGTISVTTDRRQYGACATITVRVANGLAQPIAATDHQSDCTLVTLERQSGTTWQPVGSCAMGMVTRVIELPARTMATMQLVPGRLASRVAAWQPGTYRVVFTYAYGGLEHPNQGETVASAPFTIAG